MSNQTIEKQMNRLAKLLPGGRGRVGHSWSKSGGYGRPAMDKSLTKFVAIGFESIASTQHAVPDGSHMGSGSTYINAEGITLNMSQSYGNTKYDNWFSMSITAPKQA